MDPSQRITDFSSLSVISSVEKFVRTVDAMNETVMVPSRLLNVEIPSKCDNVPSLLKSTSADPYTFYTVLNNARNSLVWGLSENDDNANNEENEPRFINDNSAWFVQTSEGKNTSNTSSDTSAKGHTKGHARKISSVSSGSVASCLSEQESERLSEAGDSGVESEEAVEQLGDVTESLRTHLSGLQQCLCRLTETALYITDKYQEEVSA